MDETQQPVTLSFNQRYHEAIVGHMIKDYSFFLKCHAHMRYEWFALFADVAQLVKLLFEFHDWLDPKRKFSFSEFEGHYAPQYSADIKTWNRYMQVAQQCLASSQEIGLDVLSRDMTGWIKLVKVKNLIITAKDLWQKKQFLRVQDWITSANQDIANTYFDSLPTVDFSDPLGFYQRKKTEVQNCCTLGHPQFDELLLEGSSSVKTMAEANQQRTWTNLAHMTTGGLVPGRTTVVIAPTNVGKTTFVTTVIAWNLLCGKKVLYIPHEGDGDDLKDKLYRSITNLSLPEIQGGGQRVSSLLLWAAKFMQNLTMMPYVKAGEMFIENLIPSIKSMQDEEVARTGKGFDLLVDDFPGKLKSKHFANKSSRSDEERAYVYDQFVLLAAEHKFHSLLPAQSNREGYKVNRGDSDRMLDESDIAESYAITTLADNVITINRSPEDVARNIIKFYVTKCRTQKTKWTFISTTQYERTRTHGIGLAAGLLAPGQAYDATTMNTMFPLPSAVPKEPVPTPATDAKV